ncbi:MAG: PAS domain S-box protein [Bacteroidales bacterium]|nr:PAS domain S-box protein [Bacteroidales bacterium]
MKKLGLYICLLFLSLVMFSNNQNDSLKLRLQKANYKEKSIVYHQIGKQFLAENKNDSAIYSFSESQKIAEYFNNNQLIAQNNFFLGEAYFHLNMKSRSEEAFDAYIAMVKSDTSIIYVKALYYLGIIAQKQNNNLEALDYFQNAYELIKGSRHNLLKAKILNNIGIVHLQTKDKIELALDYFYRCLNSLPNNEEGKREQAFAYINITRSYIALQEYDRAKGYLTHAESINRDFNDNSLSANIDFNRGLIFRNTNQIDSAIIYFNSSYNLFYNLNDNFGLSKSLINIADLYLLINQPDSAVFFYNYALVNAGNQGNYSDVLNALLGMSKVHFSLANYQKAYSFLNKYIVTKDSIYLVLEQKKISEFLLKNTLTEKEKEIQLLKQEKTIRELESERHQNEKNFFIVISILVLILAIIVYNRTRLKQKSEKRLGEQAKKLEQLSVILNKTNNAILIMDKFGNFEWMNEEFVSLSGYSFDEYRKIGITNLHKASFYNKIEEAIKECVESKKTVNYTAQHVTKSGKELWLQTTLSPILNKEDEVIQLVAIDSDITGLKKAEELIQQKNLELEEKNRQMQESEERLRRKSEELRKLATIASKTDNAVSIMDADGNFEWVNDGFVNMFGYTLEEFIQLKKGRNLSDISSNPRIKEILEECRKNQRSVTYSSFKISKWGKHIWLQTNLTPVLDEYGEIFNLIAIDSDISSLKIAEKEISKINLQLEKKNQDLNRLSIVASKTDNAVMIMDSKGNFQWTNDGFTRMYGYSFDEYCEKHGGSILQSSSNPNIKQILNSCTNNHESFTYSSYAIRKNGEKVWLHTTLTPVLDNEGKTSNIVVIESNINKLKETEEEVRQKNIKLQETNKKLMESQENLKELNAMKDKFFSVIAHDLRSPISSFLSVSDYLSNPSHNVSREQMLHFAKGLNASAGHLYKLLENLLQWSIFQTGGLIFKPTNFDLKDIIDFNIELIKKDADNKKISVVNSLKTSIFAYADVNMINTVLRNLINNSIKFSNIGGKINILVTEKSRFLEVSVEDNGVGISEANIDKLFRIDFRLTTEGTMEEKGTGLGLILCKEFVEKNGGIIKVESKPGKGTIIKFTLVKQN